MDQPFYTALAGEAGHTRRCLDMHRIEGLPAALNIKPDGVDGTVGAEESRSDRSLVKDISFRRLKPRIRSGRRSNPLGVARCCPHLESVVKQMSDESGDRETRFRRKP
jgi:hypothetical protein